MRVKDYLTQYKITMSLAFPVILSQTGQIVVQIVDNAMVGQLGADQLAAASLGGAIFWNVMILGMGISLGLTPIIGQLYVRGGYRGSAQFFQNSLLLNFCIAILLWGGMMIISDMFKHMGQSEKVVELVIPYFKYLVWSIIPFMIFNSFKQFLEGLGNTKIAMFITVFANLLNVFLNYIFIYGHFGAEAMGVAGAGLATFISRCTMPVLFVIVFFLKDSYKRYFSFFNTDKFSFSSISSLCKVGFPIAAQMFLEITAFSFSAVMMGWIGAVQLAGHQIALSLVSFSFMVVVGIASATTIRISHELGRGDKRMMRMVSNSSYHLTIFYMIIAMTMLILFRSDIAGIFTTDVDVILVASQLIILAAVFELSDGIQAVSLGMLRGIKDVKMAMWIAFFSYIVINLPIGYFFAFKLDFGARGLWIGFIFGLTVAAILLSARFRRTLKKSKFSID